MADNAHVMEFTDANFDEVINESGTLSVVDFGQLGVGLVSHSDQ